MLGFIFLMLALFVGLVTLAVLAFFSDRKKTLTPVDDKCGGDCGDCSCAGPAAALPKALENDVGYYSWSVITNDAPVVEPKKRLTLEPSKKAQPVAKKTAKKKTTKRAATKKPTPKRRK